MKLKEVACLLGWRREQVELAILEGVQAPKSRRIIRLAAVKQGKNYDLDDGAVDAFLAEFEAEDPGRYPPARVRRALQIQCRYKCAICESDAPLQFHHMIEWAQLPHHDPNHMLAVCGTCHDKITLGQVDLLAQLEIKKKLTGAKRRRASASRAVSSASTESTIDARPTLRIVWCLPRGFLMLEDVEFQESPSWSIRSTYYHIGEGWRMGTHVHVSYLESWWESGQFDSQCCKVCIPIGDWVYAYFVFDLMGRLRNTEKAIDIRSLIDPLASCGVPVRIYVASEPILSGQVTGKYPELTASDVLRDILTEMDRFDKTDFDLAVEGLPHNQALSLGHRATVELEAFLGSSHPSLRFLEKVIHEYNHNATNHALKMWVNRLSHVLSDAINSRP